MRKRPQLPEGKTGAVIPMRQARGATVTGACLNAPSDLPFPCALEGGGFTFFGGHQKRRTKAPTAGTNGALPRYAHRKDLRGGAMTAERILQVAIFGLFIFSMVLASMLILNS
jgi:hypothetical protein